MEEPQPAGELRYAWWLCAPGLVLLVLLMLGQILLAVLVLVLLGIGFALLNRKLLPSQLAMWASRFYFAPCLPCTWLGQKYKYKAWWCNLVPEDERPPVLLGAAPFGFLGKVEQLHALGCSASVNMCDEYVGPLSKYREIGWVQLHIPVVDHEEPSVSQLHAAVKFIQEQREAGRGVYLHCKAGHGRGAAVAFAWLLVHRRLTLEETQRAILALRPVRKGLWKQPNIVKFYQEIEQQEPHSEACPLAEHEQEAENNPMMAETESAVTVGLINRG